MNFLTDTIYKIYFTINEYGEVDYNGVNKLALPCKLRETIFDTNQNYDASQSDAILWLRSDAPVEMGDIVQYGSTFYKIDKILLARRLRSTRTVFIKCNLLRDKGAVS